MADEIIEREKRTAEANAAADRAYRLLVLSLISQHASMERVGENDMGILHHSHAARYHAITMQLHNLIADLTQSASWPYEPGTAATNWGRDF